MNEWKEDDQSKITRREVDLTITRIDVVLGELNKANTAQWKKLDDIHEDVKKTTGRLHKVETQLAVDAPTIEKIPDLLAWQTEAKGFFRSSRLLYLPVLLYLIIFALENFIK